MSAIFQKLLHLMKIGILSIIVFALPVLTLSLHAQVTIGSDEAPVHGALLQLKNITNVTDGKANSTKGLLYPRVSLKSPISVYPLEPLDDDTNRKELIGAMVYNVTENELLCKGLHVWQGEKWETLNGLNIDYVIDTRTSTIDGREETHIYPTQNFEGAGTWMLINMKATMYADGTPIVKHNGTSAVAIGESRYYYTAMVAGALNPVQDEAKYANGETFIYGMLYTWAAATRKPKLANINEGEGMSTHTSNDVVSRPNTIPANIEQVGVQGICPNGWHVPSDKEMNDLEKVFANDQQGLYYNNSSEPTYKPTLWNDTWRTNQADNRGSHGRSLMSSYVNSSLGLSKKMCEDGMAGFSAYPIGFIIDNYTDMFNVLGDYWTSSRGSITASPSSNEEHKNRAWYRSFMNEASRQGVTRRAESTRLFMSVRCKKD